MLPHQISLWNGEWFRTQKYSLKRRAAGLGNTCYVQDIQNIHNKYSFNDWSINSMTKMWIRGYWTWEKQKKKIRKGMGCSFLVNEGKVRWTGGWGSYLAVLSPSASFSPFWVFRGAELLFGGFIRSVTTFSLTMGASYSPQYPTEIVTVTYNCKQCLQLRKLGPWKQNIL